MKASARLNGEVGRIDRSIHVVGRYLVKLSSCRWGRVFAICCSRGQRAPPPPSLFGFRAWLAVSWFVIERPIELSREQRPVGCAAAIAWFELHLGALLGTVPQMFCPWRRLVSTFQWLLVWAEEVCPKRRSAKPGVGSWKLFGEGTSMVSDC